MGQPYIKRQSSAQTLQNPAIASVNVLAVYSDLCLQTWELEEGRDEDSYKPSGNFQSAQSGKGCPGPKGITHSP